MSRKKNKSSKKNQSQNKYILFAIFIGVGILLLTFQFFNALTIDDNENSFAQSKKEINVRRVTTTPAQNSELYVGEVEGSNFRFIDSEVGITFLYPQGVDVKKSSRSSASEGIKHFYMANQDINASSPLNDGSVIGFRFQKQQTNNLMQWIRDSYKVKGFAGKDVVTSIIWNDEIYDYSNNNINGYWLVAGAESRDKHIVFTHNGYVVTFILGGGDAGSFYTEFPNSEKVLDQLVSSVEFL